MEISGGIDICQMSFPTGATAILLLVCILSLLSTKCPAASTPAGEPFLFRCQKSRVSDAPIRFQGQGHGRPASYFHCKNGGGLTSAADRRVSPRFQYSVQSFSGYSFCLIVPYAAVRFDKRKKSFSIQVPSSVLPDFPGCRQQKSHTAITR